MKKIYFLFSVLLVSTISSQAANTLLQSPQTGQVFASGKIDDIAIAANGTDVVLIAANNLTGKIYAIDIADNNPADAAANTVTQITTFKTKIQTALGIGNCTIENFEVNPISKSVYVLVHYNGNSYIAIVKNDGAAITALNLANATFSSITYSVSNYTVQDLCWGNNTLYVSAANTALDGEVGYVTAPFIDGSSTTIRSTTMFKTNWGGTYFTSAPLEKMDFTSIAGTNRLAGVTVCAPGFSIKTSDVNAGGVLQVTQDFDMNTGPTLKVVAVKQNGINYLLDLHDFNFSGNYVVYRIGEKYIDGSQVNANLYNNTSQSLRTNGNPAAGLTDAELKKYTGYFTMIAFFSDYDLLVLENTGTLKLLSVGVNPNAINKNGSAVSSFSIFPNPANDFISVNKIGPELIPNARIMVYDINGKEVINMAFDNSPTQKINIKGLGKGNYILSVISNDNKVYTESFVK